MRAVFLASELLSHPDTRPSCLQQLIDAGLRVAVIGPPEAVEELRLSLPGSAVVTPIEPLASPGNGYADALARSAAATNVNLREACFVGPRLESVMTAMDMGLRAILVVEGRSLDELLGPSEPVRKHFPTAPDLGSALAYVLCEAEADRQLGTFPYALPRPIGERTNARIPTGSDLARIFLVITAAGVAIALGIAYILQEVYQRFTFPAIAYWLTLQFIPQTYRGLLFLAIGAVAGLFAQRIWHGITGRQRPPAQ